MNTLKITLISPDVCQKTIHETDGKWKLAVAQKIIRIVQPNFIQQELKGVFPLTLIMQLMWI